MPRFVFVGGVARSGTTLMQRILTRHPLITGGPELRVTNHIMGTYRLMATEPHSGLYRGLYSKSDLDESFRGFYDRILRSQIEKKPGARWLSEKSTGNLLVAKTLLELFPDARFILMERDPRDVLTSNVELRRRAEETGSETDLRATSSRSVVRLWRTSFELSHAAKSDPRYLVVRYETLVREPERIVREVFSFLEVAFDPAALEVASSGPSDGFRDEVFHPDRELSRQIDAGGVGRYKTDLDLVRRLYVEAMLGPHMWARGFQPTPVVLASAGAHKLRRTLRSRLPKLR